MSGRWPTGRLGTHSTEGSQRGWPAAGENPGAKKEPVAPGKAPQGLRNGLAVVRSSRPSRVLTTKAMPKKMRRAALRSALSVKASEGEILMVDAFKA